MQIKKVLKGMELKEIEEIIEKNYGCSIRLENLFMTSDGKLWIAGDGINMELTLNLKRCYRIGLYFGRLKRNKKIKLSIEGAMMVGKKAKRNIAILDDEEAKQFAEGNDVHRFDDIECDMHNFIIVKRGEDVIGVGIMRDGYIENLIPKARRMKI